MPTTYTLDITFDARFANEADRSRAEQAIYDALAERGVTTKEQARAILADEERMLDIMAAGTAALQAGDGYVSGVSVW